MVRRDPRAKLKEDDDIWCATPNIRGTQVCLHEQVLFTRVTGPSLSLNGWFLAKEPGAAPEPGWPRGACEPRVPGTITLNRGWQLYFMDD